MNLIGLGIKVATNSGVKGIVGKACAPYLPTIVDSLPKRLCGQMAVMAISGVVCDEVNKHIDKKIDELAELIVMAKEIKKGTDEGKTIIDSANDALKKKGNE